MLNRLINKVEVRSSGDALEMIRESVAAPSKISSFTHNFYKYPACFPETFPRTAIKSFSKEDDWILDPFVGGGTTAVEALAANRNFIGSDINDLAVFSSQFKTVWLDRNDFEEIKVFFANFRVTRSPAAIDSKHLHFFENVPRPVINFVVNAKNKFREIRRPRARLFATGVLLRTIQLELGRDYEFIKKPFEVRYIELLKNHVEQAMMYQSAVESVGLGFQPTIKIIKSDATHPSILGDLRSHTSREFDLVVTSPPYPQRHILYNKWQIQSRAETALPYWIIDSKDAFSENHYTMGGRDSQSSLELYLSLIHSSFSNVNSVMKKNGLVIQIVAFNDMKQQFYGFLDAMAESGFEEIRKIDLNSYDGRLWRNVPNQKWYNRTKGRSAACKEVVLFHRKRKNI